MKWCCQSQWSTMVNKSRHNEMILDPHSTWERFAILPSLIRLFWEVHIYSPKLVLTPSLYEFRLRGCPCLCILDYRDHCMHFSSRFLKKSQSSLMKRFRCDAVWITLHYTMASSNRREWRLWRSIFSFHLFSLLNLLRRCFDKSISNEISGLFV